MSGDQHDESVLVVGASQAAVQFADSLRRGGHRGPITLIGSEPHAPYQRPPLSKSWLAGGTSGGVPTLREGHHYREQGIELLTGSTVTDLGRSGAGVVARWCDDTGAESARRFDRAVLATGAGPRRLSVPGADHSHVLLLRDLDDASRLAGRVDAGPVVVIGGGFVGLEVAATLHGLGARVTVVEAGERLLGRAVGAGTADFLLRGHRDEGIEVILGVSPDNIEVDDDAVRAVVLTDGRRLAAATVVVGIGARPRADLAVQLGLECDDGVVIDDRCLASDGRTVAIGDCAVQHTREGGRTRRESVDNAVTQADIAARTILGVGPEPTAAPWFWSDQGQWKLQMIGDITDHTEIVVRTDPDKPRRRMALYFSGEDLVGAECVNAPADFVALRTALARGTRPTPDMVADATVPLKRALAGAQVTT